MNLMGMGMPEMAVVLLIAFLVLGPGKSIDMARTVGKVVGELRRTLAELTAAVTLEEGQERGTQEARRPSGQNADPVPVTPVSTGPASPDPVSPDPVSPDPVSKEEE